MRAEENAEIRRKSARKIFAHIRAKESGGAETLSAHLARPTVSWRPDGLTVRDSGHPPPASPSVRKRFLLSQKPSFRASMELSPFFREHFLALYCINARDRWRY